MDILKEEKLKKFANDEIMQKAVREILENEFLSRKTSSKDVHCLAAERIALDILNAGWETLQSFKENSEKTKEKQINEIL